MISKSLITEMDAQELNGHIHFIKFLSVKGKFNITNWANRKEKKKKEPTRPPLSFSKYTSKPNKNILSNGKEWILEKNVRHVRSNTMIY